MRKPPLFILLCWLVFLLSASSWAIDSEQLLPPDEAFQFSAELEDAQTVRLSWGIAKGYYLYRQKFKFDTLSPDVKTGDPVFPDGQAKQDKYFGTVEVYRDSLALELPIRRQSQKPATLILEATFQGCADAGVCYMPIQKAVSFALPETGFAGPQR